jgi:hypothetical protein
MHLTGKADATVAFQIGFFPGALGMPTPSFHDETALMASSAQRKVAKLASQHFSTCCFTASRKSLLTGDCENAVNNKERLPLT